MMLVVILYTDRWRVIGEDFSHHHHGCTHECVDSKVDAVICYRSVDRFSDELLEYKLESK